MEAAPSWPSLRKSPAERPGTAQNALCTSQIWKGAEGGFLPQRSWQKPFLGPVPPGMAIFHKNGNPADNSVWNLVFRTPEEIGRMTGADSTRRPVLKFSATGELLECYSSARQAAKQNYFSYQAIIDRCNGKCKRHVLAPDGNYYAWDNTVGVRKAKEDLRALARQEGRLFAPKNWPAT